MKKAMPLQLEVRFLQGLTPFVHRQGKTMRALFPIGPLIIAVSAPALTAAAQIQQPTGTARTAGKLGPTHVLFRPARCVEPRLSC